VGMLIDLERRRRDQQVHRQALAAQLQAVLDAVPVGVLITADDQLEVVSQHAGEMLGYEVLALQGQHPRTLYAGEQEYETLREQVQEEFAAHGFFRGDVCFRRKDGGTVWARVLGRVLNVEGERTGTVWVLEDMTVEHEALRQQGWVALLDPLTMLLNRQAFELRLEELLRSQDRGRHGDADMGVVLFLDLDHFTGLNALAGHDAGDDALRHVARLIEAQVRHLGYVGRLGGDEFGVLLPGCTPTRGQAVAEHLCAGLRAWTPQYGGHSFTMAASVGMVVLRPGLDTVGDVLHAADMACYEAKRSGRNRVAWHSPSDREQVKSA
jgi:diguanylate cyclase (GGDEF)-like protein/PAS domain S-box-containing protein